MALGDLAGARATIECLLTYGCSFRGGVGPDDFDDSLTKAEASEKIEELKTF